MEAHDHHRDALVIKRDADGHWIGGVWKAGPNPSLTDMQANVWHRIAWPVLPGGVLVCDECGKAWVGELWPRPWTGQHIEGTRLRRETWCERRRRLRRARR